MAQERAVFRDNEEEFTDPPGDVAKDPAFASDDPSPAVDIQTLKVSATDTYLSLFLSVEGLDRGQATAAARLFDTTYTVSFSLGDGSSTYEMTINAAVFMEPQGGEPILGPNLVGGLQWRLGSETATWTYPVHYADAENTLSMRVPIDRFWEGGTPSSKDKWFKKPIEAVEAGDLFASFRVISRAAANTPSRVYSDELVAAPEKGVPLPVLANRFVGVVLGESLERHAMNPLNVLPETNHTLVVGIYNAAPTKRVVRLEYGIVDQGHTPLPFKAWGPSAIVIPAGQMRNYTASVKTGEVVGRASLMVRATSIGAEDVGWDSRPLQPGFLLDPASRALTFRVLESPHGDFSYQTACAANPTACPPPIVLVSEKASRLPAEERAVPSSGFEAIAESGPALPFLLAKGGAVTASIDLRADNQREEAQQMALELSYRYGGMELQLFRKEIEEDIETTPTTVNAQFTPRLDSQVLPPNGVFRLQFMVVRSDPFLDQTNPIWFLPKTSRVQLPVQPLPAEYLSPPTPVRFQVRCLDEPADLVNPGKSHLYNISVLNFDAVEQRVHLAAALPFGWTYRVEPGPALDLAAGDLVTVGLIVASPSNSREGDLAILWFNATDDQGASAGIRLSLTVVTEVSINDQSGNFHVDPEDAKKVAGPPERSPGLAQAAVALGTGIAVVLAKRCTGRARQGSRFVADGANNMP